MSFSDTERLNYLVGNVEYIGLDDGDREPTSWMYSKELRDRLDSAMLAAGLKPREQPSMEEIYDIIALGGGTYEERIRKVLARVGVELTPQSQKNDALASERQRGSEERGSVRPGDKL